jgi:hypothetical protein
LVVREGRVRWPESEEAGSYIYGRRNGWLAGGLQRIGMPDLTPLVTSWPKRHINVPAQPKVMVRHKSYRASLRICTCTHKELQQWSDALTDHRRARGVSFFKH